MTELDRVVDRLRYLAGKFSGTSMAGRIKEGDHDSWQQIQVSFIDDNGVAVDVGDELLQLADDLAVLEAPKVIRK